VAKKVVKLVKKDIHCDGLLRDDFRTRGMGKNLGCRMMDRIGKDMAYCVFVVVAIVMAMVMSICVMMVMRVVHVLRRMVVMRYHAMHQRQAVRQKG